uniref:Enoyl-CoA hydratase n=1 Tax=Panagrolaimus sp. ES5 TaxID=591445 RepID=A0AC34G0Z8_9BILA
MSYRTMSTSNSSKSLVLTSKNDRIFNIFINRPERKNCVNHSTALKLIEAFEAFENDSTVDIAILSGTGETFCAGYDLSEVASGTFPSGNEASEFLEKYRFMGPSMMTLSKPLIAAIEGYAVAGGLELALLADLRVAAKNSQFGVLCRRFGVPLIDGGTIRLPAMIGFSRAMDLILTGRQFDAKSAEEWGLVNRLSEPGEALKVAEMLANEIIKHPQECLKADRKSAYYATFEAKSYQDAFNYELNNGIPVLSEAIKGAGKFIRKEHKL